MKGFHVFHPVSKGDKEQERFSAFFCNAKVWLDIVVQMIPIDISVD
jgi:hypothetical protein